jgi:glutaredoxin-like protein
MIPLRDQEVIRARFEQELSSRVRIDFFTQHQSRLIIPGRQDCIHCEDVRTILEEIAHLSPRVSLTVHEFSEETKIAAELGIDKVPGIVIRGQSNRPVRFYGIPSGTQFPGFIDTVIDSTRSAVDLRPETGRQLKKLKDDVLLQVFVTPVCRNSPQTARTALRLGLFSSRINAEVIEATEYPSQIQRHGLRGTPATVVGERLLITGALDEAEMVKAIFKAIEAKPIAPGEFQLGPATPLPRPDEATSPARQTTTMSGLVLPR